MWSSSSLHNKNKQDIHLHKYHPIISSKTKTKTDRRHIIIVHGLTLVPYQHPHLNVERYLHLWTRSKCDAGKMCSEYAEALGTTPHIALKVMCCYHNTSCASISQHMLANPNIWQHMTAIRKRMLAQPNMIQHVPTYPSMC